MTAVARSYSTMDFPEYSRSYRPIIVAPSNAANNEVSFGIRQALSSYKLGTLREIFTYLNKMSQWKAGWDLHEAKKPQPSSIVKSKEFISELLSFTELNSYSFLKPHITANSEGNIVFEWYKGEKELSVYVSKQEIFYIKAPSPEIDEMEDEIIHSVSDMERVWEWLTL